MRKSQVETTTKARPQSAPAVRHDIKSFAAGLGVSVPFVYEQLKNPTTAPITVKIGRRRFAVETPQEYLRRVAQLQEAA